MFYNVFIEREDKTKDYLIALGENQIIALVNAFLNGEKTIRVKGKVRAIENPRSFIIYNITDRSLGSNQVEIEQNMRKLRYMSANQKMSVSLYAEIGANVTDDFLNQKDWGANQLSPSIIKKEGKIFISHSSKDAELVNLFIEKVLILGLYIDRSEIFSTSTDGSNIKSGQDFKKAIKDELTNAKAVIQIVTENYKVSEVCLNEMGAAWVVCPIVIPLIASPFKYDIGFIHRNTQQILLNKVSDLLQLYDDYKGVLFRSDISMRVFTNKVGEFVDSMNSLNSFNNNTELFLETAGSNEIDAEFPSGVVGWKNYLQSNINPNIAQTNGAPIGSFRATVSFIIERDGNLSNLRPLTNWGYGMEEELVRVIHNSPKWIPAMQNGRNVKAYRIQTVKFEV